MYTFRQVYAETESDGNNPEIIFEDFEKPAFGDFKAAGFPQHFYVVLLEPGTPDKTAFSLTRLISNFGIWASFLAVALAYDFRNQRPKKLGAEGSKAKGFSILDLLVVTTTIAAFFALYRWQEHKRAEDKTFASEIVSAGGSVDFALWLPAWMEPLIPTMFLEYGVSISGVALTSPTDLMVKRILSIETLSDLRIGGGTYDLGLLAELPKKPHLRNLRISGRVLDPETIERIAQSKQLVALDLTRTNITTKALMLLGEMPRLKSLNVIHTNVKLSEISNLPFSESLRFLALPHPAEGSSDSFKIANWPELKLLICNEFDEMPNGVPVSIELSNLPKLETLGLDGLQVYDLKLENLPALKAINRLATQMELRVSAQEAIPANLQVRHFSLNAVPNLNALNLDGASLVSFELNEPRLDRLRLLSNKRNRDNSIAEIQTEIAPRSTVNMLLRPEVEDGLAASQGPSVLELGGQLSDTTFDKLAKNSSIRSLDLSNVSLDASLLKQLGSWQGLIEIKFGDHALRGREIAWLAESIKTLSKIHATPVNIGKLRLEGNDAIEMIFYANSQAAQNIEAMRLVDVPKLGDIFELPGFLSAIHIENAPSIKGLSFRSTMPKSAFLKGLRDLRHFAGGGELLTDAQLESVLECKQLEKLTVAYSSISPSVFSKIGSLSNLQYLVLTGSTVDDEPILAWNNLKGLRTLRLEGTKITDRSIAWVLEQKELETLRLDDNQLPAESCQRLGELKKLKHLSLSGASINEEVLRSIVTLPNLESLHLHGAKLGSQEMQILVAKTIKSLEKLSLKGCVVDGKSLRNLAKATTVLRFELSEAEVDPMVWSALLQQNRVYVAEDEIDLPNSWLGRSSLQMGGPSMSTTFSVMNSERAQKTYGGEVPPHFFSPNSNPMVPKTRGMR